MNCDLLFIEPNVESPHTIFFTYDFHDVSVMHKRLSQYIKCSFSQFLREAEHTAHEIEAVFMVTCSKTKHVNEIDKVLC